MASYRVIADEPAGFSAEIVFPNGACQATAGFSTKEDAGAWVMDHMVAAAKQRQGSDRAA
jgi:hypothetical protein